MLLLAHVVERRREWVVAHDDARVSLEKAGEYSGLCERRAAGVPIAYLLGKAYFYGREFLLNESVLVPRPETEHLIDEARRFTGNRRLRVLDVGTGSGAIACTIAAESNATVDATDVSGRAIAIASENARRLEVLERCGFYRGNLIDPVRGNRYDLIVANLPYVPTNDLPKRPDPAAFEPREALDGGPTGLELYGRLVAALPSAIDKGGLVLFEAAPPTIAKLADMVRRALPNSTIRAGKDYAGLDRYVAVTVMGSATD